MRVNLYLLYSVYTSFVAACYMYTNISSYQGMKFVIEVQYSAASIPKNSVQV